MLLFCHRSYTLRRVRDAFKENKTLTDPKQIKKEFDYASESLELIRRQVRIIFFAIYFSFEARGDKIRKSNNM